MQFNKNPVSNLLHKLSN